MALKRFSLLILIVLVIALLFPASTFAKELAGGGAPPDGLSGGEYNWGVVDSAQPCLTYYGHMEWKQMSNYKTKGASVVWYDGSSNYWSINSCTGATTELGHSHYKFKAVLKNGQYVQESVRDAWSYDGHEYRSQGMLVNGVMKLSHFWLDGKKIY